MRESLKNLFDLMNESLHRERLEEEAFMLKLHEATKQRNPFARIDDEYIADFETTTNNPNWTEVWAWALVPLDAPTDPKSVEIGNSFESFLAFIERFPYDMKIGFHNLGFDGNFIVAQLLRLGYKEDPMPGIGKQKAFSVLITGTNASWHNIDANVNGRLVRFFDTSKIIPMTVKQIGDPVKGFGTKYHKLEIDYSLHNKAGEVITEDERAYIANDVLVVQEAMKMVRELGYTSDTIAGCVMQEMKAFLGDDFDKVFPRLDLMGFGIGCDTQSYFMVSKYGDADTYLRQFYFGGYVYINPENAGQWFLHCASLDVNSEFPGVQLARYGNRFPVGWPMFFIGEPPEKYLDGKHYIFRHIRARINIKPGHLPCITQQRASLASGTCSWITTTAEGCKLELFLTDSDFDMMMEFYDVEGLEYIDGCAFESRVGLLEGLLNKFLDGKKNAKTVAERTFYKLLANNSYGVLGRNPHGSKKHVQLGDDGKVKFDSYNDEGIRAYFVPYAAAVTAYARWKTVHLADKLHQFGAYCYSDTDSNHFRRDLIPADVWGEIEKEIDPKEIGFWDLEVEDARAIYLRPKTYAECYRTKFVDPDTKEVFYIDDVPHITACGLCPEGKEYFAGHLDMKNRKWIPGHLDEFKIGAHLERGKFGKHIIPGGCLLDYSEYNIRGKKPLELFKNKRGAV